MWSNAHLYSNKYILYNCCSRELLRHFSSSLTGLIEGPFQLLGFVPRDDLTNSVWTELLCHVRKHA